MTNTEAIEHLQNMLANDQRYEPHGGKTAEALTIAIAALEAQAAPSDLESVEKLIEAIEPIQRLNNTPVKDRNLDGVGLLAIMSRCCNAAEDALPSLRRVAQIEAETKESDHAPT